jgi:hypothetical protein
MPGTLLTGLPFCRETQDEPWISWMRSGPGLTTTPVAGMADAPGDRHIGSGREDSGASYGTASIPRTHSSLPFTTTGRFWDASASTGMNGI